jgi:hypothetical protein
MCKPQPRHLHSYKIGNLAQWAGRMFDRVYGALESLGESRLLTDPIPAWKCILVRVSQLSWAH